MRTSLLPPLPETIAAWHDAGCPDVFAEVREGVDCWIVGTVELAWRGPAAAEPMIRVREVVPATGAADANCLPSVPLADGLVLRPPDPVLTAALARAEHARRRSIRPCADCGDPTPPEHGARLEHGFTCHACMERGHGVVF